MRFFVRRNAGSCQLNADDAPKRAWMNNAHRQGIWKREKEKTAVIERVYCWANRDENDGT